MLRQTFNKLGLIRAILYSLTAAVYFLLLGADMFGVTANVGLMLLERCPFYIAEAVLLVISHARCRRVNKRFDKEYFKKTVSFVKAAETFFVMIIIITWLVLMELLWIFVYLREELYRGAANGPIAVTLLTLAILLPYIIVKRAYRKAEKKNELFGSEGETLEEFYSFIHGADGKRDRGPDLQMPDASSLLDDAVPVSWETKPHPIQAYDDDLPPAHDEPAQLWECPLCGSLNPISSEKCNLCGGRYESSSEPVEDDTDV